MELSQIVAIVIAAVVILGAIGWLIYTRKRSERLQGHFGPEYDRRVTELHGDRRRAEAELTEREARVQKLKLRPLSSLDRAKFVEQWRTWQARFVDDPARAVNDADQLVSAAYPNRASDFREANDVWIKHPRSVRSTEDLKGAFVRSFQIIAR